MKNRGLEVLLGELETSAKTLQASLLTRDTESIWNCLERQERYVRKLKQLECESPIGLEDETRRNPEILRLLRRSRTVIRANRAMTQRFLDVVEQTLLRLGGGSAPTYAGNGAKPVRRMPVLVRQQG